MEAVLRITPPRALSISRPAACAAQKAPLRLVATTWSHCSAAMSSAGFRTLSPALLTSTSRSPTSSKACCTWSRSLTSQAMPPGPGRRARTMTSAPSSRNRCAVAAPMPLEPPVTTTLLPARPFIRRPPSSSLRAARVCAAGTIVSHRERGPLHRRGERHARLLRPRARRAVRRRRAHRARRRRQRPGDPRAPGQAGAADGGGGQHRPRRPALRPSVGGQRRDRRACTCSSATSAPTS